VNRADLSAALLIGVAFATVAACAGDSLPAVAPGAEVTSDSTQANSQSAGQSMELHREVFSYRGSGRDPFRSLIQYDSNLRPFFEDLRLVSVMYDAAFPARSVATLRDSTSGQRYSIKVGDRLGRLEVIEIRRGEVVFTRENLGVQEQVVLQTRRRGQGGI
jgi:hypothetical protein